MAEDREGGESLIGTVLESAYKIVGLVGAGGMGTVYEGQHLRLHKRIAIKIMARELAASSEALNRFHREAMVTSALGHPHIVQVFDFSTTPSGEPFLVMEFLEGEDLEHRLRRVGHLSPQDTLQVVKQVASALAATHAKEVVHRDLKPANIYLLEVAGETDFVKVLDFGISKVRAATTKLTKASMVMGTPNYMSPEQALGKVDEIDERTDQWALACIAWECLSGEGPFVGDSVPSILFQVVHESPSALAPRVAGLPNEVEEVLRCALAKDKKQRFASVAALASALEGAVAGISPAQARGCPVPTPPTVRWANAGSSSASQLEAKPSTTFTQTAGELDDSTVGHPRGRRWIWAVAGGVTAILVLGMFLVFRPGLAPRSTTSIPAAPIPSTSGPLPIAAPQPPPPAAITAPASQPAPDIVSEVPPLPSKPVNPRTRIKKSLIDKPTPVQVPPTKVEPNAPPSLAPPPSKGVRRLLKDI